MVELITIGLAAASVLAGLVISVWAIFSRIHANSSKLVELHQLLEQARERAPAQRLEEQERYLATVREEFNALLESQDGFRDAVLKNVNRLSSLINRRLGGPRPGKRTDLEEDEERDDLPERITAQEAAERAGRAAAQPAGSNMWAAGTREEVRRRIRDQYYAARRASVSPPQPKPPQEESA